jgi:hypothetical protein
MNWKLTKRSTAGRTSRARWAAIGAAVAVCAGAGGLVGTGFAAGGSPAGYVPITPCRLMDTRTGSDNVGPRATPLGPNETYSAAVHGTNGNCTIPAGAVGVVMNVAITNPTASSFLTVFPADAPQPLTANMNWVANQPPTGNAVTATLAADGRVSFYNLKGAVDVVADVMGYFEPGAAVNATDLDDRYFTEGEVLGLLEARTSFAVSASGNQSVSVGFPTATIVRSVTVPAPAHGTVVATYTANVFEDVANDFIRCSLTQGTALDTTHEQIWESAGATGSRAAIAGTRAFAHFAGVPLVINLVCQHFGTPAGTTFVLDSSLVATFHPYLSAP